MTRLRRSAFSEAAFAFPFVFWNLGTAIAASTPMITTTISSSISVKPLRFDQGIVVSQERPHGRTSSAYCAYVRVPVNGEGNAGAVLAPSA